MKKVIVSILTIVLSIPLFVSTPLANTVSQSTVTGYGSYYFTYNNDLDTFLLHLGNLGGVNMKGYCQSLIYEFNDEYSGYLDIHLLSDSIWNNATIITENCYVKGKNSSTWDYSIGFNSVSSIKVTIVLPTLTSNNAWSGNKMALTSNYNITRDLTDIPDMLQDIQTSLGTVDAQTPDMLHSLANIYGVESASRQLLSEIEYAIRGNNSLYVLSDDMGTIITDLNAIINNVNTMLTNLINMDVPAYSLSIWRMLTQNDPTKLQFNEYGKYVTVTDQITFENYIRDTEEYVMIYASGTSNVYPIFTESDTTATVVRTVRSYNNYFYIVKISTTTAGNKHFTFNNSTYNRYIYPYYYGWADYIPQELMSIAVDQYSDAYTIALNALHEDINELQDSISNAVNNIDFIPINYEFKYSATLQGEYTDYNSSTMNNLKSIYVRIDFKNQTISNSVIKIRIPIVSSYVSSPFNYIDSIELYKYNYTQTNLIDYYMLPKNNFPEIYMYNYALTDSGNSRYLYIKVNLSGGFCRYRPNNNEGISYLTNLDKTYWQLVNYFDAYKYHQESKSLLQGIIDAINSININNSVTNNDVSTNVTTYNTNVNQVYNVENNFGTQLDNNIQNYNPDNTSVISRLTASGNLMSTVLTGINGIELFTVPIGVMLVGIVILAIVG